MLSGTLQRGPRYLILFLARTTIYILCVAVGLGSGPALWAMRAALEREGEPMGNLDMMIAAHSAGCPSCVGDQRSCIRADKRIEDCGLEPGVDWSKVSRSFALYTLSLLLN